MPHDPRNRVSSWLEQLDGLTGEAVVREDDALINRNSSSIVTTNPYSSPGSGLSIAAGHTITFNDLQDADPPTRLFNCCEDLRLPASLQQLYNTLEQIGGRPEQRLLPSCLRTQIRPHLRGLYYADIDDLFDNSTVADENTLKTFEEHFRIYEKARKCFRRKPAASWREEVVRPILDLAVSRLEQVVVENLTTVDISPERLLPRGALLRKTGDDSRYKYKAQRIDYGLFIEPTEEELFQIQSTFPSLRNDRDLFSVNQMDGHCSDLPLLSLIKMDKDMEKEPLVDLAIWTSALFQSLEGLLNEGDRGHSMLPFPVILVSGHKWEVAYASVNEDGRTRMLWGPVHIGITIDLFGVYQLLRSLDVIIQYSVDKYWPWLLRSLNDSTLRTSEARPNS